MHFLSDWCTQTWSGKEFYKKYTLLPSYTNCQNWPDPKNRTEIYICIRSAIIWFVNSVNELWCWLLTRSRCVSCFVHKSNAEPTLTLWQLSTFSTDRLVGQLCAHGHRQAMSSAIWLCWTETQHCVRDQFLPIRGDWHVSEDSMLNWHAYDQSFIDFKVLYAVR